MDSKSLKRFVFGGHFVPYNIIFCMCVTIRYFIISMDKLNEVFTFRNFIVSCVFYSVGEYFTHRVLLHLMLSGSHEYHHKLPTKVSIMHVPMLVTILGAYFLYSCEGRVNNLALMLFPMKYLIFEITHRLSHSHIQNRIIKNSTEFHLMHHVNQKANFGFTCTFGDVIFRTLDPKYEMSYLEMLFSIFPHGSFFIRAMGW